MIVHSSSDSTHGARFNTALCDSILLLMQGNDERCVRCGMDKMCRVLESAVLVVLALQRRMDRVEHKVYEREDLGMALGLTRVGETTKLQSGPSTLIRRAQILPMFRSCCSSVAWSNSVGASRFMHTQDVRHTLAPRFVIPAVSQAVAHASSRCCTRRLPARSAGTTRHSARWASG